MDDPRSRKHITFHNTHLLVLFLLFTTTHQTHTIACFSLILDLQHSNEFYRNIKHPGRRVMILLIGDIESNPGPNSVESLSDTTLNSLDSLSNHLSIMHLNIQSLVPKLDLVEGESVAYDSLVFSESWLKTEVRDGTEVSILIEHFLQPFRTDRCDRPGGGAAVYVRDTLTCRRRPDLEVKGPKAVWVEIKTKSKKVLIGGFYRPPNTNAQYFNRINESIDRAYNTNIPDVIILGDFNFNLLHGNNNKMKDLFQVYNMKQLISDPTHFTENSSSLIDLILVCNSPNILQCNQLSRRHVHT